MKDYNLTVGYYYEDPYVSRCQEPKLGEISLNSVEAPCGEEAIFLKVITDLMFGAAVTWQQVDHESSFEQVSNNTVDIVANSLIKDQLAMKYNGKTMWYYTSEDKLTLFGPLSWNVQLKLFPATAMIHPVIIAITALLFIFGEVLRRLILYLNPDGSVSESVVTVPTSVMEIIITGIYTNLLAVSFSVSNQKPNIPPNNLNDLERCIVEETCTVVCRAFESDANDLLGKEFLSKHPIRFTSDPVNITDHTFFLDYESRSGWYAKSIVGQQMVYSNVIVEKDRPSSYTYGVYTSSDMKWAKQQLLALAFAHSGILILYNKIHDITDIASTGKPILMTAASIKDLTVTTQPKRLTMYNISESICIFVVGCVVGVIAVIYEVAKMMLPLQSHASFSVETLPNENNINSEILLNVCCELELHGIRDLTKHKLFFKLVSSDNIMKHIVGKIM